MKYGPSKSHALKYGQPLQPILEPAASSPRSPPFSTNCACCRSTKWMTIFGWQKYDQPQRFNSLIPITADSSDFKWFQDRRPGLHWNQMPHLLQSELACPPGEDFFLWAQWGHVYPFVVSADIWLMEKVFLSLVVSSTRLPGATFASICISTQALPNAVKSFAGLLHALDCDICIKRIQKWTPKPQQALVCVCVCAHGYSKSLICWNKYFSQVALSWGRFMILWCWIPFCLLPCFFFLYSAFEPNTSSLRQSCNVSKLQLLTCVPYFEAVCPEWCFTGTDLKIPERTQRFHDPVLTTESPKSILRFTDIYIYMYIYIYIHMMVSINGAIPLSLDGFGKIPNKNSWIPRRMPSSLAPNPRGRLLLFRGSFVDRKWTKLGTKWTRRESYGILW